MVDSQSPGRESWKKVPRQAEAHDDDYDDDEFHTLKTMHGEFDTCNCGDSLFLDVCECRYQYCVVLTRYPCE